MMAVIDKQSKAQVNDIIELKMHDKPRIGIDSIVVSAPQTNFSSEELGKAIGVDPKRISEGLGIEKTRLPIFSQSNVTMVADSIYLFIKNMEKNGSLEDLLDEPPKNIYFATESNDDYSRPEAEVALGLIYSKLLNENEAFYRPYIDMFKHAELKQTTFACAGVGLVLSDAVANIKMSFDSGRLESAIILSVDTAVYDSVRAPNAEMTQGSGATLMWIKKDPKLIDVDYTFGYGRFNMPYPDFTKFGINTPKVYGRFSEIGYVYAVAQAFEDLERNSRDKEGFLKSIDAFVSHVPFPKQAIYFASFLWEHYMKVYDKKMFEDLQNRDDLGISPLNGNSLVELITKKIEDFRGLNENDLIDYIANDNEIKDYWDWLKRLRTQINSNQKSAIRKEFSDFLDRFSIKSALKLPSIVGNSYTGSTVMAMAGLLYDSMDDIDSIKNTIAVFYGSGLIAKAYKLNIIATPDDIANRLVISMNRYQDITLTSDMYKPMHDALLKGDAARTTNPKVDLIEQSAKLLRGDALPVGFHIRKRNDDGTWEAAYVDEEGNQATILPRF